MEDKNLELIERYYRRELDESSLKDFETRLASDSQFREEVALHGKVLASVRLKARENLKKKWREQPIPPLAHSSFYPNKRLLRGIAVLILALTTVFFIFFKNKERHPSPTLPINPPSGDTLTKPVEPPVAQEDKKPQSSGNQHKKPASSSITKGDTGKLFTAYFQPYKDETLNPSVRSDEIQDDFDRFMQLYWEGKNDEALAVFEKLSPALQGNDNTLFLKANALLAGGQAGDAIAILEKIISNGRTRYLGEARWYLALSYLKSGEQKKAVYLLKEVAGDTENTQRREAKKILSALD